MSGDVRFDINKQSIDVRLMKGVKWARDILDSFLKELKSKGGDSTALAMSITAFDNLITTVQTAHIIPLVPHDIHFTGEDMSKVEFNRFDTIIELVDSFKVDGHGPQLVRITATPQYCIDLHAKLGKAIEQYNASLGRK